MATQEMGFQIQGRLYPWVGFDDWTHDEIRAVRAVTGYNPRDLLIGQASAAEVNAGFATVSFWRGHPEIDEHELVRFMGKLRPSDIEARGFEALAKGDDARPPETPPGEPPSGNTGPSSGSTPEKSPRKRSGSQPSPTDSTSGPQPASES